MKKILILPGVVASLITFASAETNKYVVDVMPTVGFFKAKGGVGMKLKLNIDENLDIYGRYLNGSLKVKDIEIRLPYKTHLFFKHINLKTDVIDKNSNYIGFYWKKFLSTGADDYLGLDKNDKLSYVTLETGIANSKDPYYIGLGYDIIERLFKNYYGYSQFEINKYKFGTEYTIAIGLSHSF